MIKFDFAPINTGFAKDGTYDDRIIKFHNARSGKGIETSYIGNISTSEFNCTNNSTAFFSDKNILFLEKLSETITQNGSAPGIQIATRISAVPPNRNWTGNIHAHTKSAMKELCSLTDEAIENELELIKYGIKLSIESEFSIIQLHAAHGYLFSHLLSRVVNKRTGKFAFGRLHWVEELSTYIRTLSSTATFDIRINILDGLEEKAQEFEYKQQLVKALVNSGCQKISLTNGFYDVNKELIYPQEALFASENLARATVLAKSSPNTAFSIAGSMLSVISPHSLLPANLSIALGRALIADPNAVVNFRAGKKTACTLCGECHYYSHGKENISCPAAHL